MLLLNPIVRKTSEKRSRWWTRLAGFGLWSVLQPICMSLNIRSIKEEHDDVYTAPFLVALWHNRTMVPGYAWSLAQKPLKMSVLTSASKDGALVEAVCRHFGLGAVRGSSGRRGALAYMEMMRKVQEGDVCFCFTPDGPRGPIYEVHHGIVKLASQSGLPIVPVCIEYESCWRLNKTWDRYAIPKPCSNVNILWKSACSFLRTQRMNRWRIMPVFWPGCLARGFRTSRLLTNHYYANHRWKTGSFPGAGRG